MSPYDFALIASEAYTAKPDIGVADSASRAIVRETTAGIIVAFPGTDNVPGWLADFDVLTVNVPGVGEVHRGFYEAWQAIEADVLKAIGNDPVTLVGHSLGGALSLMAAVSLTLARKLPASVFGFEAPRVSPTQCVVDLLKPVNPWLCRNRSDPVPEVPLLWHAGGVVRQIGGPAGLVPDIDDHMIGSVLASLAPQTVPA